ncbi:MAG: response regulator transcription factor [Actinomycetota bacterium]|nr:response regulator transcription factor [Actinomycetota bacterium]
MATILIIEDDQRIRQSLSHRLAERGHEVDAVGTAMAGVESAVSGRFDVVVLDLGLPDLDGAEALRMIRAISEVPVVVATARDDEGEIVRLLDAGADDYVVKPYSAEHLEARLRAVLRRSGPEPERRVITVGQIVIDLDAQEARFEGRTLDFTAREFELLAYLAERPGTMVSKRQILAEVWHQPYGGADKTIDVHLSWLRKKLGESAADPKYILTRRGVGVRLVDPDS